MHNSSARVLIPLRREKAFGPRARRLNPWLAAGNDCVVLDTPALGAAAISEQRQRVADLSACGALIQETMDTLFGGY